MVSLRFWGLFVVALVAGTNVVIAEGAFTREQFVGPSGEKLNYRLHVPEAQADASKLPLVLFLHGSGERGDDNEAQLKHGAREFLQDGRGERFPAILVAPQCPSGKRWVEIDWAQKSGVGQFPAEPSPAMKLVFGLLDEMTQRADVDLSRLYVTGLSMGGYGTWYAGARYRCPGLAVESGDQESGDLESRDLEIPKNGFAAMLAVCGGGDPLWADRYAATDIWAVHGGADSVVPVVRSREMISSIANQGHSGELRYTERPGVGHDSWSATYADEETYRWLFAQIRL
ncbi:hypothetical protein SAMN06265222_12352 [Neorhodopirellula lusitana]|uniref:Uncharacterized protein n=1 Tax=Neorhodopirellula lusitana TaxID=445327 RepID=A0ABY1QQL8_9BACT|nr:phospholipase [Neorhodopirellula lusitana]SMP77509.1 hypothetical protein SAMN06265222_12352 [Neorhodopirellula lusitana]